MTKPKMHLSLFLPAFAAICCLLLAAACRRSQPAAAPQPTAAASTPLPDTPENRRAAAQQCVDAYPLAEFGADLTAQAAEIVGHEVAQDARAKVADRVTAKEFQQVRIDMLVKNFTAPELVKLAELYRTRDGRSLLNKMRAYNDDWRQYLEPLILRVLSNAPEQ